MSAFSAARRAEVAARAGHRCEYCRLLTRGQVATFPIDHVVPKAAGGTTDLSNLALTCPHCNSHKGATAAGPDPTDGNLVRFFHPREDVWEVHFSWSPETPGELVGRTPTGRATIEAFGINAPDMIELRVLLMKLGLFPEAAV
ncbi:MAG TPA: HNH endonuclease signature motif containing protein [Urbifossiella sp.]|nr:HNH endonuclease signature motif containing protein [Urbifossiella sp.]